MSFYHCKVRNDKVTSSQAYVCFPQSSVYGSGDAPHHAHSWLYLPQSLCNSLPDWGQSEGLSLENADSFIRLFQDWEKLLFVSLVSYPNNFILWFKILSRYPAEKTPFPQLLSKTSLTKTKENAIQPDTTERIGANLNLAYFSRSYVALYLLYLLSSFDIFLYLLVLYLICHCRSECHQVPKRPRPPDSRVTPIPHL